MDIKEQAHNYLVDKGCLSVGQTYTAFQVEIMLTEFAQEQVKLFCQPAVMPLCEGNCGMNYCDDNGCIERKRALVEPKDLPEHGA